MGMREKIAEVLRARRVGMVDECGDISDAVMEVVEGETERRATKDVGRCGAHAPRMVPAGGIKGAFCALPAGHAGWHRGDDGCEWNAAAASSPAVSAERLAELEEAERTLGALEAAGVDNWSGYDEAMAQLREQGQS